MSTGRRSEPRGNESLETNFQGLKSDGGNVRNTIGEDDDCSIIFDSEQISTETQPGPHSNVIDYSKEISEEECSDECRIVFDSQSNSCGTFLNSAGNDVSLNNHSCDSDELFGSFGETSCDRQTLQILESRKKNSSDYDLDMEEVSLDFEPSLLHTLFHSTDNISTERKNELLSQGIAIRSGKWSRREDDILLRNWCNFVEKYQIDNPVVLLGLYRGQNNVFKNFIRAKKFLLQLGRDLNDRLLRGIYARARKLLDVWNYKGRLSEKEKQRLLKLHSTFGNKWSEIAILMRRPAYLCHSSVGLLQKTSRNGPWTKEEDNLLLKSVKRHVGSEVFTKFRRYPWMKIAEDVPGRNVVQCRAHWLTYLAWKPRLFNRPIWKKLDSALLIYLMYSNMVEEECFIDWDALFEKFKSSAVSYVSVQQHWFTLKSKVPDYSEKDHEAIVIYLYKNYLPKILNKRKISISDLECVKNAKPCNYLEVTLC